MVCRIERTLFNLDWQQNVERRWRGQERTSYNSGLAKVLNRSDV
jgi:hypothetical protein